jgi:hypothetical protein
MHSNLAVLIKSTNGLIVHQLDYRSLGFPIFISFARVIVHALHTVPELQPRLLVCRNLARCSRWEQIEMRLLVSVWDELRNGDGELVLDLEKGASLEPILVAAVRFWVFNGHRYL